MAPLIQIESLFNREYKDMIHKTDPIRHLVDCYQRFSQEDPINTMLAVDRETFLPDDLLFKIDIATMQHGLEARSPFLDHHLVKFVAGLPGHHKLKRFNKKYILKQALKDILPREILKRPKRGFDVPVTKWLREELKDFSYDMLLNNSLSREVLEINSLRLLIKENSSGRRDFGRLIWTLLMFEMWLREFF